MKDNDEFLLTVVRVNEPYTDQYGMPREDLFGYVCGKDMFKHEAAIAALEAAGISRARIYTDPPSDQNLPPLQRSGFQLLWADLQSAPPQNRIICTAKLYHLGKRGERYPLILNVCDRQGIEVRSLKADALWLAAHMKDSRCTVQQCVCMVHGHSTGLPRCGRPRDYFPLAQIEWYRERCVPLTAIARIVEVSPYTLKKRIVERYKKSK